MSATNKKSELKARRKKRVRKNVHGDSSRPRLSVFRSAQHIYAQVINDDLGVTLVSASSFEKGSPKQRANMVNCEAIGLRIAERCLAKNITKVVFDKNGNKYHGRIKVLADKAREGGLQF
jgi:large subunit ribosomal protein L18